MIIIGTIIKKDNKYLMIREAKKEFYGQWSFPAGHLEKDETLLEGAIRETKEETGCDVKITNILPILEFHRKDETIIRITYFAEVVKEGEIIAKDEVLEKRWFSTEEIKNMPKENIRLYESNIFLLNKVEKNEIYPLSVIIKCSE